LLQRLTERTFYGVPTLAGLSLRKTLSLLPSSSGKAFQSGQVNELHREVTPLRSFDVPEVLVVHVVPLSDEVRMFPSEPTATNVLFP